MAKGDYYIDLASNDVARMQALRLVLTYEASVRGLTNGQTFIQLLCTSANVEEYPDEVRDQLRRINENVKRRAIEQTVGTQGISQRTPR